MKNLKMQNHWYLALLGLIGLWKFPDVWQVVTERTGEYWGLTNLLWFLWFLYLVPEVKDEADQ